MQCLCIHLILPIWVGVAISKYYGSGSWSHPRPTRTNKQHTNSWPGICNAAFFADMCKRLTTCKHSLRSLRVLLKTLHLPQLHLSRSATWFVYAFLMQQQQEHILHAHSSTSVYLLAVASLYLLCSSSMCNRPSCTKTKDVNNVQSINISIKGVEFLQEINYLENCHD